MTDNPLLEERIGAVAVLTLNVPARRNAISMALRQMLRERLRTIEADADTRAVVLCGAGGTFCSGGDLTEMVVSDFAGARLRMERTHQLVRTLVKLSKPVVAAVEGWAAGAGMSIALCCDFVVAERIGIAHAVVPSGTALDAAMQWANRLAERAPLPIAMTKAVFAEGLDALLDRERDMQAMLLTSADHADGKAAFMATRAPRFTGH